MKSKRILVLVTEILLFLSIAITLSWLLSPIEPAKNKELSFEEAVIKLKSGEIKEIVLKQSPLAELTDLYGKKLYINI